MKSASAANPSGPGPAFLSEAPRPSLPMAFFLPAVVLLLAAAFAAPFLAVKMADWTYQQEILALVHTVTLGFLLAVFLGASVQLLPVVAGVTVTRTLFVRAAAVCYFAGTLGMVFHFAVLRWNGLVLSAAAVTLAVILFFFAVLPVLVKAPSGPVRLAFVLAYSGLALTMTAGLLIGLDRRHAFLPGAPLNHLAAHLNLGLLTTFTAAIWGVSSKLLPMFLLAPAPDPRRQSAALLLLFGGAVLLAAALWLGWPSAPFAALPAAAFLLQVSLLRDLLRRRRRGRIDAGFRYALSAYADLFAAGVVGLLIALGVGKGTLLSLRLPWVYGFLLLGGWVLQTVVGILSKILPFLVWQAVYARRAGLGPLPKLADLSSERLQMAGFVLFRIATVGLAVALFRGRVSELRVAATFLAISLLPFTVHVALVVSHLTRPRAFAASPGARYASAH
ncbi:MAG TPA: hypothetical protein VLJ18_08270 [Thermoanaerobaculia bacterium]|nr:hypothetical protein [Thermoanaerobaculia bacterium]